MISSASPGFFGARGTRNEASIDFDCENRPLADLGIWEGGQSGHGPETFPIFLERNLNGHFTKIHLISKFNLPFSRTKLKKLSFIVTLPHNTICYLSFHLASKFNTKFYKKFTNFRLRPRDPLGASSLHPLETCLIQTP